MFLIFTLAILGILFFIGSIALSIIFDNEPDMFVRKKLKIAKHASECTAILLILIDLFYIWLN